MEAIHSRLGQSSAWRIFPLGALAGGVFVAIPLGVYLLLTRPQGVEEDVVVFAFIAMSVVGAFIIALLLFLFVAQWATEEAEKPE